MHTQTTKRALQGSTLLFVAMMFVNIMNYVYALALGRLFGPVHYGAYASFMSLFLLLTLFPLTLQQISAKYIASGDNVRHYLGRLSLGLGSALGLTLIVFSAALSTTVHLPQSWLVGFGLVLPAYALLGTLRGEVQGQQKFRRLGINLGLEVVVKVALTPLALLLLPGISGAILATLAAIPTSLVQVWHRTKSKLVSKTKRLEVRLYALPVFTHLSAQAIIINSDVLMVNALLPAREAGIYAAVALIGRAIFYGSWAVGAAVFPMVTARHKAGQNHHQLLYLALIAVGLFSLSATAFCSLFPELVITLLFGSSFSKGAALVAPYALMTSLYTLANVISNHYLALGNHRAGYLSLVGVILQITLILSNHDTSLEVIWGQMWAKGILLGLLAACAGFGWFSKGEKHVLQGV